MKILKCEKRMYTEVLIVSMNIYEKLLNSSCCDTMTYRNSFIDNKGNVSILIEYTYEQNYRYDYFMAIVKCEDED
jgi:hypothetical protein